MLKQRIITAVILIPIVIALLIALPPSGFCLLTMLLVLVGAWEWSNLMEIKRKRGRIFYVAIILFVMIGALFVPAPLILAIAFVWWLLSLIAILFYPRGSQWWGKSLFLRGLMGVLILVPCWASLSYIRMQSGGLYDLFFLLVLIWGADSMAYFVGKKWGKTKLAPTVSPGKSLQGLAAAIFFSILLTVIALGLCQVPLPIWPWMTALSVVTVCFSVIGDLCESMVKRQAGLKDSGTMLPGHGGWLDRIDSLTAAAPVFALGATLLGIYFG